MERSPEQLSGIFPAESHYRPLILLADDDDDLRYLLRITLEHDGYRVAEAGSGIALLAELQRVNRGDEPPALVIADERMPGIRGIRVLEQAREWGWSLPLLLMTAFGDHALVDRASGVGVKVLKKPFDMDDFRTIVQWFVPRRMVLELVCAACGRTDRASPLDGLRDVFFCAECHEEMTEYDPDDPRFELDRGD